MTFDETMRLLTWAKQMGVAELHAGDIHVTFHAAPTKLATRREVEEALASKPDVRASVDKLLFGQELADGSEGSRS